jgi:hypothetical protein
MRRSGYGVWRSTAPIGSRAVLNYAINYMPTVEWKGGTAIFIPYDRIEPVSKGESIDEALDRLQKSIVFAAAGRLTRVTATIDGHILRPFIPKEFLDFLGKAKLLKLCACSAWHSYLIARFRSVIFFLFLPGPWAPRPFKYVKVRKHNERTEVHYPTSTRKNYYTR